MKLMSGGPNWRTYDFQFRAVREYQQCPWDTVRVDLKRDAYLGLGMASRKNHIVNTVQDVQEKIFQFTIFLTHSRDVETNIGYHVHRGFWLDPVDVWSRDGIYPNTSVGRKKIQSISASSNF